MPKKSINEIEKEELKRILDIQNSRGKYEEKTRSL